MTSVQFWHTQGQNNHMVKGSQGNALAMDQRGAFEKKQEKTSDVLISIQNDMQLRSGGWPMFKQ